MSPADLAAEQARRFPFGVSGIPGAGSKRHIVSRRTHKTLCGKDPISIFGIDLTNRRQITCMRCYKLGFTSVNARASQTPDFPLSVSPPRP